MSVSGDGVEDQLAIGHDDVTYTLLKSAWRRGPQVDITIQGARYPVQIPAAFLEGSGDNTWTLVLYMLHALVNEEGQVYARAPEGTTLQPVKTEAAPVAGEYLFKPKCELYFSCSDDAYLELTSFASHLAFYLDTRPSRRPQRQGCH